MEKQFARYVTEAKRLPGQLGRDPDAAARASPGQHRPAGGRGADDLGVAADRGARARPAERAEDRPPSCQVKVGDVITFKPKIEKLLRENMESLAGHDVPGWIEFNPSELKIKIIALPTSDQIPFDVNTNLIVEFYRG
jgi:hypothetical protein